MTTRQTLTTLGSWSGRDTLTMPPSLFWFADTSGS
jgi:hypothetical protein